MVFKPNAHGHGHFQGIVRHTVPILGTYVHLCMKNNIAKRIL